MRYKIVRLNIEGKGNEAFFPCEYAEANSYETAKIEQEKAVEAGHRQVRIFGFEDGELPEIVTWGFVLDHEVK